MRSMYSGAHSNYGLKTGHSENGYSKRGELSASHCGTRWIYIVLAYERKSQRHPQAIEEMVSLKGALLRARIADCLLHSATVMSH